ncbi:uncharacterized protein [Ptychodera flava]|uniref:uncharacterized protein n=1 Tax=Ptychodera flava TaxID=63121 RepID=UPI00396A110B
MRTMSDDLLQVNQDDHPRPGSDRSNASSASSSSSHRNKELLKSYHNLAAHIFSDGRSQDTEQQFLAAARDGNYQKVLEFLQRLSQDYINVDCKDQRTGNTPIIWATKRGHTKIVQLLLKYGADITLRNFDNETALDVASVGIRTILLDSVERTGCTTRHLLQAAWQGNVKVLKRVLSESKMMDINCRNADGFTPLLLVTRDIDLFEKIGKAVKDYNPVEVVSILVQKRSDVTASDLEGKSSIHMASSSKSRTSEKLVALLLKDCPVIDAKDKRSFAPIHSASQSGQTSVLVALIDKGADVNCRGFAGVTPLHVSAQSGHEKIADTLLEHGADILLVDDGGNTAVDVAKTRKIKTKLKEAWAEATQLRRESVVLSPVKPPSRASLQQQSLDDGVIPSPTPAYPRKRLSEVVFDFDDLPVADHPTLRNISPGKKKTVKKLSDTEKAQRAEMKMMQDIESGRFTPRPNPRKFGIPRNCSRCESRNSMVITPIPFTPVPSEHIIPQQSSPRTPEKIPQISKSPSSPDKSKGRILSDKKYKALNRSFEEDGVKNSRARAHQRLAQRNSDPLRKSTAAEYSPVPVTVLGLELDDNLQEIRFQRVSQGPIGHMIDKKKGGTSSSPFQPEIERSGSFHRTYPQQKYRCHSNPSVIDVTEACNNYLKRGKRLPRSLSNLENSDEIVAPPPKLAPVSIDNPRLKIPYTIQEGQSTMPLILDLDQMHVRVSADSPMNGSTVYPNSKSLLPPSPAFSGQVESIHHDPVLSFHAEENEGESEGTHHAVHNNGISHNASDEIKLAVPDPMQLTRSKSFLDRTNMFNIQQSRVRIGAEQQQEAPLSSRSNESSSYSSSLSSLSTPSPRTSFDVCEVGPNLRKSGVQMTPAATPLHQKTGPPSPPGKQAVQSTLVKTTLSAKTDQEDPIKKPSSSKVSMNQTYPTTDSRTASQRQPGSSRRGSDSSTSQETRKQSSKLIDLNPSNDRKEPVRRTSHEHISVPSSRNTSASQSSASLASVQKKRAQSEPNPPAIPNVQKKRAPSVSSEPNPPAKVQATSQVKPTESIASKNESNIAKTAVASINQSSSAQSSVTQNGKISEGSAPSGNQTKDTTPNQQKVGSNVKQEQTESSCQSASTRLLFSRLAGNNDTKANQSTAKNTPRKVELFKSNTPRNAISAGPGKRFEYQKQNSTANNTPSPRKEVSSNSKTAVIPVSKSAGSHLTRNSVNVTAGKDVRKPAQQTGKTAVTRTSNTAVPGSAKPGQTSANMKDKVGSGKVNSNQASKVTVHATQGVTVPSKQHGEQNTTKVDNSAKAAIGNSGQKTLSTSKQNHTSASSETVLKGNSTGSAQNRESVGGKDQQGRKTEEVAKVNELNRVTEGKTQAVSQAVSQQVKSETDKKDSEAKNSASASQKDVDKREMNKMEIISSSAQQKPKSGTAVPGNIPRQGLVIASNKNTSKPKTEELLRKAAEESQNQNKEKNSNQSAAESTPVIHDMMESMRINKDRSEVNKVKVEITDGRGVSAGRRNLLSASRNPQKRTTSARDGRKGSAVSRTAAKKAITGVTNQKQLSAGKKKQPVRGNAKPGSGSKTRSGSGHEKPKSAKGRGKAKSGNVNSDVVKKGKKGTAKIIKDDEIDKTAFITGMGWQIKTGRNENDDVIIHGDMMYDSSDSEDPESVDVTPRQVKGEVALISDDAQNYLPETMDTIKEFADTLKSTSSDTDLDPKNMSINDKIISEIRRVIETEGADKSPGTSWKINKDRMNSSDSQKNAGSKSNISSRRSSTTQPITKEKNTVKPADVPVLSAPAGDGSVGLTPRVGYTDESDNESSYMSDVSYDTNPELLKVFHVPDHFESSEAESVDEEIEGAENMEDDVQFESKRIQESSGNDPIAGVPDNTVQPVQQNVQTKKDELEKCVPVEKENKQIEPTKQNNANKQSSDKTKLDVPVNQQKQTPEKSKVGENKKTEPKQETVPAKTQVSESKSQSAQEVSKPKQNSGSKPSSAAANDATHAVAKKPATTSQNSPEKEAGKGSGPGKNAAKTDVKKVENQKPSDASAKIVQKPPLPKKETSTDLKKQNLSAVKKKNEKQMNRKSSQENRKSESKKEEKVEEEIEDDDVFEEPGAGVELSPEQHAAKLSEENISKLHTLLSSQTQDDGEHSPAVKLQKPSHKEFDTMDSFNSLASEIFSQSLRSDATDVSDRTLTETLGRPDSRTITNSLGKVRSANSSLRSESASTIQADLTEDLIHWKKGQVLGRGAFGTVFCGLTNTGKLIAVKQVELSVRGKEDAEKQYEKLQEEVDLLKTLDHVNIVTFLGTCLENNVVNIFMQFVPGGSIAQLLARFGELEEPVFCRYTKQVLKGVDYLHDNSVIHRDIKGGNVMLMPTGVIKLIDFGCAKRLCMNLSQSKAQLLKSMRGTPYWMAPEVVMETGHGTKSDIWSIGCTVFEMATRKPPWSEMTPMAAIFAIGSGDKPIPKLPDKFSDEAKNFVDACMQRDQDQRPTAKELLKHPFILRRAERSSLSTSHGNDSKRRDSKEKNEIKEKKS